MSPLRIGLPTRAASRSVHPGVLLERDTDDNFMFRHPDDFFAGTLYIRNMFQDLGAEYAIESIVFERQAGYISRDGSNVGKIEAGFFQVQGGDLGEIFRQQAGKMSIRAPMSRTEWRPRGRMRSRSAVRAFSSSPARYVSRSIIALMDASASSRNALSRSHRNCAQGWNRLDTSQFLLCREMDGDCHTDHRGQGKPVSASKEKQNYQISHHGNQVTQTHASYFLIALRSRFFEGFVYQVKRTKQSAQHEDQTGDTALAGDFSVRIMRFVPTAVRAQHIAGVPLVIGKLGGPTPKIGCLKVYSTLFFRR